MLLSARDKLLRIELDSSAIMKFSKWIVKTYEDSNYGNFLVEVWDDILRLISQDEVSGIQIFKYWLELLQDFSVIDFVIYCIKLRLVLLETLFSNTHKQFVDYVSTKDEVAVKALLFSEIESMLTRLEQETDLAKVDKLRDRFDFLTSLSKSLD